VQLSQEKLTAQEARRNLGEMQQVLDENHRIDVLKAIWQKEDQEENKDRPTWFDDDEWSGWGSD
jgi:hypothetical protein|tara:strand:- start:193 stop:384 length:192 start_codon:yes stop_codon:yes gene_type:complete